MLIFLLQKQTKNMDILPQKSYNSFNGCYNSRLNKHQGYFV